MTGILNVLFSLLSARAAPQYYLAVGAHITADHEALQFNAGDRVLVTLKDPSGRWEGTCYGHTGYFPASLVRPLPPDGTLPEDDTLELELDVDSILLEDADPPQLPPPFDAPHLPFRGM